MSNRMTELDALNILLGTIGSSPLTSLSNPQNADALSAQNKLDSARKEIQAENWYFNSEENFPLVPDAATGFITIPPEITTIDSMGRFGEKVDVIVRGNKLYDRENHTYKFDTTIYANVLECLDFDELPETAKLYVVARAARQFQEEMLGDTSLRTWTREDEAMARGRLIDEDLRQRKLSFGILPKLDPTVGIDMRNL